MNNQRPVIELVNPLNKELEKKKFMFDPLYNPQFVYAKGLREEDLLKYGPISDTYLPQAKHILDTVIKKWGTESVFLDESDGPTLTREKITEITQRYLEQNSIDTIVRVRFSARAVSPASMNEHVLTFRLPPSQRERHMIGTLHHEIGTHFFRRYNDEHQPWYRQRLACKLHPHYETEEGLAVLHAHLHLDHPYLWFAALYYHLVYWATKMTFVELNEELKKYVDDKERRWNMCLRVKRGVGDTSIPGAFSKDQTYLRGTINMLEWLENHEYDPRPLYMGKIAAEDLKQAQSIANTSWNIKLPLFLQQFDATYVARIKLIKKENGL